MNYFLLLFSFENMEKISSKIPKNWGKKVRKSSALLENIQKNNVDYSKENKNTLNNQDSIKKIKNPQKKVEIFKNTEGMATTKLNKFSEQIIDDNMKMLFANLNKKYNKDNIQLISNSSNSDEENDEECEYFLERADKIRYSYIQKLVSKAYFLPKTNQKNIQYNSLIILDWDDTLFPTSFLSKNGYFSENIILAEKEEKIKKKLEKLEKSVLRLINISLSKGEVFIITNASEGWVEYTSSKYYQKFYEILDKIKIISARGEWEGIFPDNINEWKMNSFSNLRKYFDSKLVTNILCLGDSMLEIEAGKFLANCFQEAFIKTIKFKEDPKPDELNKQLTLVTKQFNIIHSSIKSLTIRVEKRKVSENENK